VSFLFALLLAGMSPLIGDAGDSHKNLLDAAAAEHPEATPFEEGVARSQIDAELKLALATARSMGKRVIIVMGANWCHDSRALAGWFETPRFAAMLSKKYEIVYVDAGKPQRRGEAHNQHIIKSFGGKKQKNTPYVMIVSPDGKLLNRKDAKSWRNAASRSEEEIYGFFASF